MYSSDDILYSRQVDSINQDKSLSLLFIIAFQIVLVMLDVLMDVTDVIIPFANAR